MKKNNIFKHEMDESSQAKATLNCLKNRNNPKKLNESKWFDARFQYRSDLRKLANPVTKKAYMILYNEFGDNMWRQIGIDDCNERGLIDILNDYQKYFNITNPQDLVNKILGRKVTEQEETTPLFDSEQERHDIALATTYCLGESFIDNDGDLDDIYYAVLKYFDSTYDAPETADYENVLQWCRKHYKQIESMIN